MNKFIRIQSEKNPDFQVELFIEPTESNNAKTSDQTVKGSVNLIVSKSKSSSGEYSHTVSDVLSLNTSMVMTGFCLANNKARANTNFYNDIAISNRMGAWGFMNTAIEQLWWITPKDWDRLNTKTKKLYVENYMHYKDNEEGNE